MTVIFALLFLNICGSLSLDEGTKFARANDTGSDGNSPLKNTSLVSSPRKPRAKRFVALVRAEEPEEEIPAMQLHFTLRRIPKVLRTIPSVKGYPHDLPVNPDILELFRIQELTGIPGEDIRPLEKRRPLRTPIKPKSFRADLGKRRPNANTKPFRADLGKKSDWNSWRRIVMELDRRASQRNRQLHPFRVDLGKRRKLSDDYFDQSTDPQEADSPGEQEFGVSSFVSSPHRSSLVFGGNEDKELINRFDRFGNEVVYRFFPEIEPNRAPSAKLNLVDETPDGWENSRISDFNINDEFYEQA